MVKIYRTPPIKNPGYANGDTLYTAFTFRTACIYFHRISVQVTRSAASAATDKLYLNVMYLISTHVNAF